MLRGGGENVTRNLFPALAKRGHHVTAAFVANWRGKYPLRLPEGIEPVPLAGLWSNNLGQSTLSVLGHYIPQNSRLRKTWHRIQAALEWRAFAWHKRRFRRRAEDAFGRCWNDFDAVYVHGDPVLASSVSRHRPTVLFLPGPVEAECESMLRGIDAVCAHDDCLDRIRAFLGEHATELSLGLDTGLFSPGTSSIRSRLGWGDRDRVVGYVGRLTHLKGIDLLAAAFREVAATIADARLLIVGRGEDERLLRTVLAREYSQGRVHVEPGVDHDDLPAWYRAMNLVVMPSRYETKSSAVLEGLACGIPFLASNVGGNRSLMDAGGGWLFESESISSLEETLRHLLEDPATLAVRGEIGRRYIQNYNTWTASAERLEQIFFRVSTALPTTKGASVPLGTATI